MNTINKDRKVVKYIREHYNKGLRKDVYMELKEGGRIDLGKINMDRKRKKQRIWTLNRSPHGNKTAREQFGMQIWQLTVCMKMNNNISQNDRLVRRKSVLNNRNDYVNRKEVQKGI